jgi:hypothetical protein
MALSDIIDRALALATAAYDAFFTSVVGLKPYRDLWVVRSDNPCVFCRNMESLSASVFIPPGGAFPAPNYAILQYLSALDLTYVENPPAHEDCQCERVTVQVS